MRGAAIAVASAVGAVLIVPAVPLAAEEPPPPPTAVLEAPSNTAEAGKPLKLDSSRSSGGAPIVGHEWDLDGNGSFEKDTGSDATVTFAPPDAGPLTVHVRVTDESDQTGEAALDLTVTAPPPPKALDTKTDAEAPPAREHHGGTKPPERQPDPDPAPAADPAEPQPTPAAAPADPAPADAAPESQPDQPAPHITGLRMSAVNTALVPRHSLTEARKTRVVAAASSGVTIKNFKFAPASITVHVGDTISWTNQDSAAHTATASNGSFDTGTINKGGSGSATFSKAGTIAYICSIHPFMKGTVVVTGAGSGGGNSGSGAGSGGSDSTTPDTSATSGGLPQTGLNLAAVVLLAFALSGSGSLLRWRLDRRL